MGKNRLEAFSDGVLAIIITIMVLELRAPEGHEIADLRPLVAPFLSYVLSFLYLAIYWNNHHHMLHTVKHVSAAILWSNMNLLFWLSLFPLATAWLGESWLSEEHVPPVPAAVYGGILLMAAIAYYTLERAIVHAHGRDSVLAEALGTDWKGKMSPLFYVVGIAAAFVHPWVSALCYVAVAMWWIVPDRRIERALADH